MACFLALLETTMLGFHLVWVKAQAIENRPNHSGSNVGKQQKTNQPFVEIVIPKGKGMEIKSEGIDWSKSSSPFPVAGLPSVTNAEKNILKLPSGVQVRTHKAQVTIIRSRPNGEIRLRIEPMPAITLLPHGK
jgi:hypothetical protein